MARITDGKRTVEITLHTWQPESCNWTPDWSLDFLEAGSLPYDEQKDAYVVEDVDYVIDQANDWAKATGDFYEDEPADLDNRAVEVEEV